jgi:histidyl-tRNA synthetase
MSAKTHKEPASVLEWLKTQSEATLNQVVEELLKRPAVTEQISKFVQRAAKTKGQVDKNVEALLHLLNLPSRSDLEKLRTKLDVLQGTLVNLNMKLDRLLAAQEQRKKRSPASH